MKRFREHPEYSKIAIQGVLDDFLFGRKGMAVLELAGGTGQHASYFARRYGCATSSNSSAAPACRWTSTDYMDDDINSIEAYLEDLRNAHCCFMDCSQPTEWASDLATSAPSSPSLFDILFVANMTHISPFACTEGLFAGAALHLKPHGRVVIYGPFGRHGTIKPESNIRFDASLRQRNPLWGYRDVEGDIVPAAAKCGLALEAIHEMPDTNWLLLFKRAGEEEAASAWPAADDEMLALHKASADGAARAHADAIAHLKPADADY